VRQICKFSLRGKKNKELSYQMALLGSVDGIVMDFSIMDVASSALEEHFETNAERIKLTTKTLDVIAKEKGFNNVSFIKLDVQGFELEVLKGGTNCLKMSEAVFMEINLLDLHIGCPLLHDVTKFMYEYGFVAYDICSVSARRPLDRALWQTDILFVKENSQLRTDKRY